MTNRLKKRTQQNSFLLIQIRVAKYVLMHDDYDPPFLENDIGLIRLTEPLNLDE